MRTAWPILALVLCGAPAWAQDGGLPTGLNGAAPVSASTAAIDRDVEALRARHAQLNVALADLASRDRLQVAARADRRRIQEISQQRTRELVRLSEAASETATVSALHSQLSSALRWSLDQLDHDLSAQTLEPQAPVADLSTPHAKPHATDLERQVLKQVQASLLEFVRYRQEIAERRLREQRRGSAHWLAHSKSLRNLRFKLYQQLSGAPRKHARRLSAGGLANAQLEARYIRSYALGLWIHRADTLQQFQPRTWRLWSHQAWSGLQVFLLIIIAWVLNRRLRGIRMWLHSYQVISSHSLGWHRRATQIERHLAPLAAPALSLAALTASRQILTPDDPSGILAFIYLLVWWVGAYWLLRTILSIIILWAVGRNRSHRNAATRRLVQWTSTTAAGTAFAFGLVHDVLVLILGRAVLYFYAQGAVYSALIVMALWVVQRWRSVIADAYLRTWPVGRLARLVQASRQRYYGFFVAVFAVALVLLSSFVTLIKNFLMGFDQARKALAFIFRKRLELRAEEEGGFKGSFDDLPKTLRRAFSTEPVLDGNARIDLFAGLSELETAVHTWARTSEGGSFLLRADRGFGKSTWTRRAVEVLSETMNASRVGLQRGTCTLAEQLSVALELDVDAEKTYSIKKVQACLQQGEKRLIVLEDVHRLFFRRLGGYAGVDDLIRLLHATRHHVFWVLTTDDQAWRFTKATRPDAPQCRHEYKLLPWSEDEITQLLMARAAASGIAHHFEDLLVEDEDLPSEALLAKTSAAYTRLIWDYSDGCPMVAVHFWLRSLVPLSSTKVRVRLFRAPDEAILRNLPSPWVFMLGAIAQHETLSAQEAATVLGLPEATCTAAFEQCREQGLLDKRGNTLQHQISVYWYRSVERFLRERHLI